MKWICILYNIQYAYYLYIISVYVGLGGKYEMSSPSYSKVLQLPN